MQTRSSSRLTRDQSSNPTSSMNTTPKGRNRRGSKHRVESSNLEEHLPPIVTMADNRTIAEFLRAPTEGYAEAIVVPPILAEQFELKHSLINMMTTDQFFGLEKDNPHDHIPRRWLEKEPLRSITTWEDLVSKFINEFFPPSRTTSLRNEISNFQQRFDESFHEAWDRYKDLLRTCPHHGFTGLHQLDIFYNALNPGDQDSLNAATGGNLLEKSTLDVLTIIENKSKVRNSRNKPIVSQVKAYDVNSNSEIAKLTHAVNQQTSAMTTAMTAMLKQFHATQPPTPIKAVEEICVTYGGAHPYYQCLTAGGNTFLELRDNIQGYVLAAAVNYNQGNSGYHPQGVANQIRPPAITTRSGLVIDGPTIPTTLKSITPEVDERVEETYTDPDLAEYTIKVPPPPAQKYKPTSQREFVVHQRDPRHPNIPYPSRMLKQKQQEKNEVQIQIFWQMFKQLHINITLADALILMPNELKCKALADLGASINLMPLSVWKKLGLPELIPTRMTLELANRAICTPAEFARDVFVPVDKFTFPADFVIVDFKSDPRVLLILGRPFLRTPRALIDDHGEEMILRDGDERLTLNMRHDMSSYSNQPQKESVNLINIFNVSSEDYLEDLFPKRPSGNPTFSPHPELTTPKVTNDIFDSEGCNVLSEKLPDLDSTKDLHPHFHDNPLSCSTTYSFSSNSSLEEFIDELALFTYPPKYDDNLQFDIESDLKEIEFLLYQDKYSSLKDSIDQKGLANLDAIFVDPIPEMFTDEHTPDYSSPLIFDVYDDDFLEVESDFVNVYDDPFDSKEEKIKESKLLIDELDLPCDFLLLFEYDSFNSHDISRVDGLPSTNNEDKFKYGELGQAQRPKTSASWEAPHAYPIPGNVKTLAKGFCTQVFISSASIGNHVNVLCYCPKLKKTEIRGCLAQEGKWVKTGYALGEDTSQPPPPIASTEAPQMVSSVKLPILKNVILNGNSTIQMTKDDAGNEVEVPPVTAQQILARRKERKAKSTLLMAIPKAPAALMNLMLLIVFLLLHAIVLKHKKTGRKPEFNGKEPVGFDKTKVECFNYHRRGNFSRDCRTIMNSGNRSRDARNVGYIRRDNGKRLAKEEDEKALGQLRVRQQNEVIYEEKIGVLEYDVKDKSNLLKYTQKLLDEALREKEELKAKLEKFETSSKNVTKLLDSQISAKVKTGLGYDSHFNEKEVLDVKEEEVTETVFDNRSSDEENSLTNDRFNKGEGYHAVPHPFVGNYMPPKSDLSFVGLDDSIYKFKISETVTSLTKDEKDALKTSTAFVEKTKKVRTSAPLIQDWDTYSDNNSVFRLTHIPAKTDFVKDVFTRSERIQVSAAKPKAATSASAAKPVNTAGPKQSVNFSKTEGHPQQALKNKGIVNSGCSRHMTRNRAYLADYQEINDGGFVAFGSCGGKITGKDPLGKFKGKADEGFLVGYFVTSRALRVFNTKTKQVEENMHVRFLENKLNVAGNQTDKNAGPQDTNGNAGTQDNIDARKEVCNQHYIMLPLWSFMSYTFKRSDDKATHDKPKDDIGSKTIEEPVNKEDQAYKDELDRIMSQEKEVSDAADALRMDAGGPSSSHPDVFIHANTLLHVDQNDSQIPNLEDTTELSGTVIFNSAYDADVDIFTSPVQSMGAEAEFNNMESSTVVSPIPTHRVHIDHPKDQILGDLKSAVQTRGMVKKSSGAHAFVSYIPKQRRTNYKDYENCLFAFFLSQMKPKKVAQALDDGSWVEAMQEEQEEGTDYDEVFALVARIEAIRIILAFASFMGFIIYQMDVKSAFLYGTIEEDVRPNFLDPSIDVEAIHKGEGSGSGPGRQENIRGAMAQIRSEGALIQSFDPPLSTGYTVGSGEDRMEHDIKLTDHVPETPHDSPLSGGDTPGSDKGSMKLKELMDLCTTLLQKRHSLGRRKVFKHGRKNLKSQQMFQAIDDVLDEDADTEMIVEDKGYGEKRGSIAETVSTARPEVSTVEPKTPPTTTTLFDDEDVTIVDTFLKIQNKGKGILQEPEPVKKKKKKDQDQIEIDVEVSLKIQAHLDEEVRTERERQEEASKATLAEMYDELAKERGEAIRSKPHTKTQLKNLRMTYLKHTGRFTHAQLKSRSFKEIQKLYIEIHKWVNAFVPIRSEEDKKRVESRKKRAAGSSSKQKSPKKQKVNDQEYKNSDKEHKKCLKMVPDDDKAIDYETLDVKSPIVDLSINMFVEKRYPLTKEILEKMLSSRLEADTESTFSLDLIKFIKLQIEEKWYQSLVARDIWDYKVFRKKKCFEFFVFQMVLGSSNPNSVIAGNLKYCLFKFVVPKENLMLLRGLLVLPEGFSTASNPTSAFTDEIIANPNAQIVRDDMVRVQVPRCMTWLDYDEHVDSISVMDNEVGVTSPESTTQNLPSFEEYKPSVTYPKEVEKTLGTSIEVEPLNETKLEKVDLNCNHNTPFSSREVPSFDGPEPQPLLHSPSLDVSL
uniref:Reverse transcriptase domain-containing protein n=1 Tax=Tanacetum cinerariifolium TaxID=118510 RepID=A0A6L2L3B8_TANCI|nr:hypothetical protein [Tanacetum cinerariifolium]